MDYSTGFYANATEEMLDRLVSGTEKVTPQPNRAERVAAVLAEIQGGDAAASINQRSIEMVRQGRDSKAALRAIIEDPNLSDTGRASRTEAHRQMYSTRLIAYARTISDAIDTVGASILPISPSFAPSNAVDAATIAGISTDFESYDLDTAHRVCREAIARGDLPLVKRLFDRLTGLATWRKPFVNNGDTGTVLEEMADALATPDVIRSDAARQWCEGCRQDLRYFVSLMRKTDGAIDPLHIVSGAVPRLFPDNVYPV